MHKYCFWLLIPFVLIAGCTQRYDSSGITADSREKQGEGSVYACSPQKLLGICKESIPQYFPETPEAELHGFSWSHTRFLDTTRYSLSISLLNCDKTSTYPEPFLALLLETSGTQFDPIGRWGMPLIDIINNKVKSQGIAIQKVKTSEMKPMDWSAYTEPLDGNSVRHTLEELKKMHDEGLITDQEYAAKRQQLLDSLK